MPLPKQGDEEGLSIKKRERKGGLEDEEESGETVGQLKLYQRLVAVPEAIKQPLPHLVARRRS